MRLYEYIRVNTNILVSYSHSYTTKYNGYTMYEYNTNSRIRVNYSAT